MEWYMWLLIGVWLGMLIGIIINRCRTANGILRIDQTNPDRELYRFDIGDLDKLKTMSRIVLKIDHDADLSQK